MRKVLMIIMTIIPLNCFAISASSIIAMDMDNGRVLYGYNLDDKRLIASTTKIMTAIVAIENGELDKEIIVDDVIYQAFGSAIYIEVGEKITLKDLLYGLMLRSGNDASLVIAKNVAGTVEEFVYLMNEYANNLDMNNTIFYNPHGLEEKNGNGNTSSVKDMALLTKYAMGNNVYREIVKTKNYTVKTNYKTYSWTNKNKLLNEDYITGGKTGYTEKARRTLVTTGSKNNINVVVVTLNDPNDWQDHKDVYKNIFDNYKSINVINKNKYKIDNEYYDNVKLYVKNDCYVTLNKNDKVVLNNNIEKKDNFNNDEQIGNVEIFINDELYHNEPIYIKKLKDNKKTLWQKIKDWLFR